MSSRKGGHSGRNTMRAVVWEGKPFEMAVRDVPRPKLELPEDAIVRVTSSAICGTDLHIYRGVWGSSKPDYSVGHEAVGIVDEVGKATEKFKVGDRVIVPGAPDEGFLRIDGTILPTFEGYGLGEDFGGLGGTQAEYLRVPFADDSLVKIPDEAKFTPDSDWLFISDIWTTGWSALDNARFQPGETVAVFGCGPVGLFCIYSALLRGAARVYAIDHVRERLDKAASLGAIPIDFTSDEGTASEQILKRQPEGVDRSCDCVGFECVNERLKPQQNYVLTEAIKSTSYRGGIGVVGVYSAMPNSKGTPRGETIDPLIKFPISDFFNKGLSLGAGILELGTQAEVIRRLFELVKSKRANGSFVVSSEIGIEDAPKFYKRFDKQLETKVIIRFPWNQKGSKREGEQEEETDETDESEKRLVSHKRSKKH